MIELDQDAAATVRRRVAEIRDALDHLLDAEQSRRDLVEPARAHLAGEVNAQGAAVIAAVVAAETQMGDDTIGYEGLGVFADAWVREHGLVFAATATAELSRVFVAGYDWGEKKHQRHLRLRSLDERDPGYNRGQKCLDLVAARVRALLAVAGDGEYQEAVEALAGCRRDEVQHLITAYLMPTQTEWVDAFCAALPPDLHLEPYKRSKLMCALGSIEQLERVYSDDRWSWLAEEIRTVVDGVGSAVVPMLLRTIDNCTYSAEPLFQALGVLPTDEAFELLVARLDMPHAHAAAIEAAGRFPKRAVRVLADAATSGPATIASYAVRLLRDHVAAHPELATEDVRQVIEKSTWAVEAPPESLPRLLVEPPWNREHAKTKPVTVRGLKAPDEPALAWEPGEREAWAAADAPSAEDTNWDETIQRFQDRRLPPEQEPALFLDAPEDRVRPLLTDWRPSRIHDTDGAWMKPIVARFGLDALPAALDFAEAQPAVGTGLLLPFSDAKVAALMAGWLVRRPKLRPVVQDWFGRHAPAAARALVPAALGRAGQQRRDAEAALRFLASGGRHDEVVDAARGHGDKAARAIETLLATDPLEDFPADLPYVSERPDPYLLPEVLLRDGGRALPTEAADHIITMLLMCRPDHVYAGIDVVKEICDPASLAAFAWGLFERSALHDEKGISGDVAWVFTALSVFGDDETVRRFTPIIRTWPGKGGHHRAVEGLDVLVAIGTDVALMHLNGIAQKVKYKGIKAKAQERITALAAELGLTPERLADRLVPDLGLDAAGSLTLDYGPRRFTVGFDEQLKPYVLDEDGVRRAALPKPGARDDQELAPAAYKRFAALKKDVRTVAANQIDRLEQAMVTQRRWTAGEFRDLIARHPLLWHIARRLLWITEDGPAFRIAEDRTLADIDDKELTLRDSDRVGIAHPLLLGADLSAWAEIFADYEILQPFPQLGRPTYALTDEERAAAALERFHDITVPVGQVLGMERRGWLRGTAEDNGIQCWIYRPLPGGRGVVVDLDPGITVGDPSYWSEQRITQVWLSPSTKLSWRIDRVPLPFSDLDPVTASEVLTDLTALATA
ncbi:DUF4132 domain-containing protein [Actinomadura alba]|uniref:DUF4132 domain-containing protein n=1 Tax=Actinomadura alba TaxID=406431 RepID=A0ABR7M199_9ACTN|nr:DUF4132 domain-containing protein [Actinomadura alba]MBC6470673.1 DUF4132 domain-containing protein [Actinomadura alba]